MFWQKSITENLWCSAVQCIRKLSSLRQCREKWMAWGKTTLSTMHYTSTNPNTPKSLWTSSSLKPPKHLYHYMSNIADITLHKTLQTTPQTFPDKHLIWFWPNHWDYYIQRYIAIPTLPTTLEQTFLEAVHVYSSKSSLYTRPRHVSLSAATGSWHWLLFWSN